MLQTKIVIPTFHSEKTLACCLASLVQSINPKDILVIDSSNDQGCQKIARSFFVEVVKITKGTFNHGLTREVGRKQVGGDIVVMMTPDAIASSTDFLEKLIEPIKDGKASLSYARQLPHKGSSFFASFHRRFLYPEKEHLYSIEDLSRIGDAAFFCSNSCAAWSQKALDDIGGFAKTSFGEDTIAALKLLQKGHKIAYTPLSKVYHSHNHSLKEEFQRYLKIGAMRREHQDLFSSYSAEKRGLHYAKALLQEAFKRSPLLFFSALTRLTARWAAYRIGKNVGYQLKY